MSFPSYGLQRCALLVSAMLLVSACTEDGRPEKLSEVPAVDIPTADVENQVNQNISDPTLSVPETYQVEDGDLLTLVWSDEFDGDALDPEIWFYESGDGSQYGNPGWGNNELQYYLPDSVQVNDGVMEISAKREIAEDRSFTSGRVMTRDRIAFEYGRIEASIKLPGGQGIWPAFWLLPQDSVANSPPGNGAYGNWPASGEIDIVEAVNLDANPTQGGFGGGNEIFATMHYGGASGSGTPLSAETRYTPGVSVTENFNTYALEWDEFELRWYFNGNLIKMENSWSSSGGAYPAPFDQQFYMLFNVAVGGNFPGPVDASTPSPSVMQVDWVRVYSGEAPPPPTEPPFDSGLLTNGDFEDGPAPWLAGVSAPIGAENIIDDMGESVYFVDVTSAGDAFAVNLSQKLTITPDETYTLSFRARSNVARTILAGIGLSDGDFSNTTESVSLTTAWADYSVELTAAGFGDANSRALIDMGAEVGEVYIDKVKLEVSTGGGTPPFDPGLLTNGDFESGVSPWLAGVTDSIGMANLIDDMGNTVYFVNVESAGDAFAVNLSQKLSITPDESYTLTFRARSNVARTMLAGIGLSDGDFSNTTEMVSLTAEWQDLTVNLTTTGFGDANSRVLFDMGAEVGEVYIDNVSLVVDGSTPPEPPPFDPGLLTNGDFEAGTMPWLAGVTDGIPAGNVIDDMGNAVYFNNVMSAGDAFAVNLSQKLTITPDESYTLTFKARSNVARTILAGIGLSDGDFANTTQSVSLTTEWQDFTVDLTAAGFGDANSRVLFDMGAEVGEVYLDDVSLKVATSGGGDGTFTNGDFETGDFTGWTLGTEGTHTVVNTTEGGRTGNFGRLQTTDAPQDVLLSQVALGAGTIMSGDMLDVSFDLYGSLTGDSGVVFVEIIFLNADGNDVGGRDFVGPAAPYFPNGTWTTYSGTVTAGTATSGDPFDVSGGVTLQLKAACGGVPGCAVDAYFDNVTFTVNGGGT